MSQRRTRDAQLPSAPTSTPSVRADRSALSTAFYRLRTGVESFRKGWKRFWSWRKLRFSRSGIFFTGGTFAVGFAAINTGNNLLYLLLGAMLGFIAISSWLSEQVIGKIRVRRKAPRGVTVGNPVRIRYQVSNQRRRMAAFALEIGEEGLPGQAFIPFLKPGGNQVATSENRFIRRGVFPLRPITVSTSFPFGLFRKTLTLEVRGELTIWPRTDRKVRQPQTGGGRSPLGGALPVGAAGPRGEYRGLRGYRPGDDPRDIHWRTTARLGRPVVKEYEENRGETLWICLDTRAKSGARAEDAVETAASLAARAYREGRRFGFSAPSFTVEPGQGPGQLERVLNALARVDFHPDDPRPTPPTSPRRCVLVSLTPNAGAGSFGDVMVPAATRSAGARGGAESLQEPPGKKSVPPAGGPR